MRPIKIENKKNEEKNNLEVVAVDYRRHKSSDHKREKSTEKKQHRPSHVLRKEVEEKNKRHKTHSEHKKREETNPRSNTMTTTSKESKSKGKSETTTQEKTRPSAALQKPRRTSSSEKKLVKSVAVCDDADVEPKLEEKPKPRFKDTSTKSNYLSVNANGNQVINFTAADKSVIIKPPNILVYAESFVAKENVKTALATILNRDK